MRFVLAALLLAALPAFAQYGPPSPAVDSGPGYNTSFQPLGKTANLAASTSSATIALSTSPNQVQVYNSTTGIAFVIFCTSSSCTAHAGSTGTSTSDYPVAPGAVIVMTVPANTTYAAAVLSTSTGAVYFTPGQGL